MPSRTKAKKPAPVDDEPISAEQPSEDIDPYEVLSIAHDATEDQIKRAYRKAALKHHPDKATGSDKETAHTTFQTIAFAYSILSNPSRRARYDATGSTSTSALDDADETFDWSDFFKARYEELTVSKLDAFRASYKGGEEERRDLLSAFVSAKGDMDRVYESVMLSNVLEDDERFREILDEAVEKGEVEGFKKYVGESEKSKERRRKRAEREAEEAEEELRKREKEGKSGNEKGKKGAGKSSGGEDELMAMIQQRQKDRGAGFLDQLEAKYAAIEEEEKAKKGSKSGRKRKQAVEDDGHDEPPEEAFKAMQDRMQRGKKAKH